MKTQYEHVIVKPQPNLACDTFPIGMTCFQSSIAGIDPLHVCWPNNRWPLPCGIQPLASTCKEKCRHP